MAPRGRKKAGMMREDAARDAMRTYGFDERVIKNSIKELLEVYGEDHWRLIEEDRYEGLLSICLEKQGKEEKMAEEKLEEKSEEEEEEDEEEKEEEAETKEQEQHVDDGRDHVGSNSTSLVGFGTETGTQAFQTDRYSITSEAVMNSSPAPFLIDEAPADYSHQPVGAARNSRCGWLSSEEETDPEEDGDDDEMIQLTPEPLCKELEELLREVREQKKRKRATRWDN